MPVTPETPETVPARHSRAKTSAPDSSDEPDAPDIIGKPDANSGTEENAVSTARKAPTPTKGRKPDPTVDTPPNTDKSVSSTPASPKKADKSATSERALEPGSDDQDDTDEPQPAR